jgi:hypothetical protein
MKRATPVAAALTMVLLVVGATALADRTENAAFKGKPRKDSLFDATTTSRAPRTTTSTVPVSSTTSSVPVSSSTSSVPVASTVPSTTVPVPVVSTTTSVPATTSTVPVPVSGDLFVAPGGSDANPGTSAAPFRTIQKAADVVNPGQVVVVRDGVYTQPGCGRALVCVNRGGASGALVTFKAEHRWGAKLDGGASVSDGIVVSADFVRIEGFDISRVANPTGSSSGIELYEGGSDSQIVANNIHDIGRICTQTTNGEVGIYVERDRVSIERNYLHNIGRLAPGEAGCAYPADYTGWQIHDHGIYLNAGGGTRNTITIRNNIFATFQRGWAVQIYRGAVNNLALTNNTLAYGNPYRDNTLVVVYDMNLTNTNIRDNIFYDPTGGKTISMGGALAMTNTVIANNLTTGTAMTDTPPPANLTLDPNQTATNPQFVNPQTDYHLQPGSPAIDTGTPLSPTTAYDGTPRPQSNGWDIGAYEQ